MPTRSAIAGRVPAGEIGGHRVAERPGRPRVDADLRRQLRVAREPAKHRLGEREPLGQRRHRGGHVGAREVAQRGQVGHRAPLAAECRTPCGPATAARLARLAGGRPPIGWPREHRPEPRQPQARAGRGRPLRRPRLDRAGPAPGGRLPPHRGRTSAATRTSGRPGCASWARRCPPATRPRVAGAVHHRWPRGCSGRGPCRDLVQALEGDEEAAYEQQETHPEIAAIAADEREHAEIWKRLDDEPSTNGARRRGSRRAAIGAGDRRRRPRRRIRRMRPRRGREPRGDHPRRGLAPERPVGDAAGGHLRGLATAWSRTCRW